MFGLSYAKLIGGAVALLAVLGYIALSLHWKNTMTERGEKLATICAATRAASGHPKLKCGDVPAQIGFMGEAVSTLTEALHKQNDAVAAMGAETRRQQAESARASQKVQERAREAQATSDRLTASSRAGEAVAKPCEPSKALQEAWR